MSSRPVRIPEETYERLRRLSGLLGKTPGSVLEEAFQEYVASHRGEIQETFDHAKKFVASRDVERLASLAGRGRLDRAKRAAAAARRMD
jgi:hypothetical protein